MTLWIWNAEVRKDAEELLLKRQKGNEHENHDCGTHGERLDGVPVMHRLC
jgi:hypothetical protein